MDGLGIFFTILAVLVVIVVILYFVGKKAGAKQAESQAIIDKNRQTINAFIIDKKKAKVTEANFPQSVIDQMPKRTKLMKLPLVKVKVGPQIVTMICDKPVFEAIPLKKNVRLEVSGGYILGFSTQKKGEKKVEFERKLTWREKLNLKLNDWQNAQREQRDLDRQEAIAKEKAKQAKAAAKAAKKSK
ncbi:MAG: hypothetical protein HUJ69_05090 [Lachnospiraceae bacterium]|nr:hypothetical protein [Lachnospiraceae bacterium]